MVSKVTLLTHPTIRLTLVALTLLLSVSHAYAGRCASTRSQQASWVNTSVDNLVRAARDAYEDDAAEKGYNRVLANLSKTIKKCGWTNDVDFMTRYGKIVEYVRVLSLDRHKDHQLGFEVSDREYFERTSSFVSIPEFLTTQEFLLLVRRAETLTDAKALLRRLNQTRSPVEQLLFLSYESRHLGTPDNDLSYLRLLIVVPGDWSRNIPEKWVQFGIADRGSAKPVRNVSVVSVVPDNTEKVNVYFKDYFRTYRGNRAVSLKGRWELGYGDDNCVKCHKSGVLPIFPVEGSVSDEEKATLEMVNQRFRAYAPANFGGFLDTTKLGPGLGAPLKHATSGATCAACHQPGGLGSLSWPMDSTLISSFVESGRMPMGSNLTIGESSKLYRKVIDEYFSVDEEHPGVLKSWLLRQTE